ncbi:methylenetetrahydrofolate reductase (NAD(P)H) met13 [Coemansia spiralis]|uniref:Methylenetetrahydrofolate reductase (NAD(P)H) met13 n=2 Tax=Coemansia TaxID=4863 RepID=A0A9W8KXC1_9FUNG|nr:methylenetetrahydrofolate reductase-domain-containing protein [Coemansia spiralis]KAJ1993026.1 methylenetetrahydrofolate reductase (NAD(P)H) met13 [Coemansia umbellata]KAJ2622906.1 methylenetetrahydrofolate reductase (NAD(P)H) met13 [Coemansia sp. RSA 1358]KAJ2678179.1 methylenetetrahydrofolate reductase (NAD(P)H) met13 [Coemansia spiralis]
MKLSERLAQQNKPFFSFEYFPPKTEQGLVNLYDRIERMSKLGPLFVAVTWGAGGGTALRTLELCGACQSVFGIETVMHLTCTNMDSKMLDAALEGAKTAGVRNILALRGDPPRGEEYWTACDGLTHAADLVQYIRARYGDYFCIGVAGYPEGHIENTDKEEDFRRFVEKVHSGADFVVSQIVYDARTFVEWERKCRAAGVAVPIVPGVLPIQSYQSFRRLVHLTKVNVPEELRSRLELVKANDQAVKDLGVRHASELIEDLNTLGVKGVHLTTLNLEHTVQRVLEHVGLAREKEERVVQPQLAGPVRADVWDDFPNGRWGDARSPAFGTVSAWGAMLKFDTREASRVWGRPRELADISSLFVRYVANEIPSLPWSDEPLLPESQEISAELTRINQLHYWTLASQPALDAVPSTDPTHGWGPRGGYVYQKAFVECFVPAAVFPGFLSRLQSSPQITYYAANQRGDFLTNSSGATALTWGVFPGRSVVQPTLIDKMNFLAWRAEAFAAWREWAEMFSPESPEYLFLCETAAECWLVNVVDNEFKKHGIWEMFQ